MDGQALFMDDHRAFCVKTPEPRAWTEPGILVRYPKPNPKPNSNKHDAESPPKLFQSFGSEKLRVGVVALIAERPSASGRLVSVSGVVCNQTISQVLNSYTKFRHNYCTQFLCPVGILNPRVRFCFLLQNGFAYQAWKGWSRGGHRASPPYSYHSLLQECEEPWER